MMKRSFIREILEHTTNETISFAGGLPDAQLFPLKQLQQSANNVLNNTQSLQYTTSTGIESLKEKIAKEYSDDGFETDASNIIITSGSQQALDIITRYYNNRTITLESPSYLGAMNIFQMNNLVQDSIPLYEDGIDIKLFEKSFQNSKFSYLIPDYQNPTGYCYSIKKREAVAKIVEQTNGIIIEDTPYSNIYFDKKRKSISSMVPKNSFHIGSFSKTLAPSLRVGWIRADEELLSPLIAYKEAMDLHTNGLAQYIINDYLEDSKEYKSHLKKIRKSYYKKMQIFTGYLDEIIPEFEYEKPQGGMFVYGRLPNIDTSVLVKRCLDKGVVFVPGVEFYEDSKSKKDEIRFNFTNCKARDIYVGLIILLQVLKEM
jgi:2-aminoadipate transaminase